jgi:hypothetical protein
MPMPFIVRRLFRPLPLSVVLGALATLAFIALLPVPRADGELIGSDGVGYYVYLRSWVIDGDLDLNNEYAYFAHAFKAPEPTPLGLAGNKLAVGTAIFWLPFYLLAHLIALLGNLLGFDIPSDGYSYLYQSAISFGSIFYGSLGMYLAARSASRLWNEGASALALGMLWMASNVFYYMVFEPSMSHMVALFCVSLLLWYWHSAFYEQKKPNWKSFALLGAAGGAVLLVRVQDGIFLLLPYGYLLWRWIITLRERQSEISKHWLIGGLLTALFTFLVFTPQLYVWQTLYGSFLTSPYTHDHDPPFYWLQPQLWSVLFSSFHGLFSWHPIFLLALIGLLMAGKELAWQRWALVGLLALNLYLVAAWWAWWQGDSFGGRMFISAFWIWQLGLCSLINRIWHKRSGQIAVWSVGGLLLIWNMLSLIQYRLGYVPMGEPLTWQEMTIDRLRLPWLLLERLLN